MQREPSNDLQSVLQQLLEQDLFFVAFRLPGSKEISVQIQTHPEIFTFDEGRSKQTSGFVLFPFKHEPEKSVWLKPDLTFNFPEHAPSLSALPADRPAYNKSFPSSSFDDMTHENYVEQVNKLAVEMRETNLEKVVFSRCIRLKRMVDLSSSFLQLEQDNPGAFVYLLNLPGKQRWMGATPETILSVNDHKMFTMALAGTRPTNGSTSAPWGKKEMHEHAVVAGEIVHALNGLQLTYEKSGPFTRVINKDITHLCSEFTIAQRNNTDPWKLLERLHPTSAVCGSPRELALQRIGETESYDRTYYTGFLGPVMNDNESRFFVNLRCARFTDEEALLFVGGGLTADSDAEAEWQESELKTRTILNSLRDQ